MARSPRVRLALGIDGLRMTELLEETIEHELDEAMRLADAVFPDDVFVGQTKLSSRQRFARAVMLTDPADFDSLQDEDYLKKLKKGLAPPLVSPFWRQLLAFPEEFSKERRAFLSKYEDMTE